MNKVIELKDVYVPLDEHIVVEVIIPSAKTKAGLDLIGKAAEEFKSSQTNVFKVIAVGPTVKDIKVGNWILPCLSIYQRPNPVPLVYKVSKEGIQHLQIHRSEIMGIVDSVFAQLKPEDNKEKIIN